MAMYDVTRVTRVQDFTPLSWFGLVVASDDFSLWNVSYQLHVAPIDRVHGWHGDLVDSSKVTFFYDRPHTRNGQAMTDHPFVASVMLSCVIHRASSPPA